jgi:hypothetical protein
MRLVVRARAGDQIALDELFARFGPELRRFARGRLPHTARGLVDTPDVVQDALLQTFLHLEGFEHRGEGALRAYMRQVLSTASGTNFVGPRVARPASRSTTSTRRSTRRRSKPQSVAKESNGMRPRSRS